MKFTYQGRVYEFDESKMHTTEAIAIKHHTGMTPKAFYLGLEELDPDSYRCVVLLGLRRAGEPVRFDEIEFDILEFAANMERSASEPVPPTVPATGTHQWPGDSDTSDLSPTT